MSYFSFSAQIAWQVLGRGMDNKFWLLYRQKGFVGKEMHLLVSAKAVRDLYMVMPQAASQRDACGMTDAEGNLG
jgi:hypothetical protein